MRLPDELTRPREGDLVQVSDTEDTACGLKAVVVNAREDGVDVAFLDAMEPDEVEELVPYRFDQVTRLFFIKLEFPSFLGVNGRKFMRITDKTRKLNVSTTDFGMDHLEALMPVFKGMAPVNNLGHPAKSFYLLAYVMADGNLGFEGEATESIEEGW